MTDREAITKVINATYGYTKLTGIKGEELAELIEALTKVESRFYKSFISESN